MKNRQQGLTMIGFILIAAMVGMIGYGAVRLIPVYLTQMKIRQMLSDLKTEYDGSAPNATRLASDIGKRLNIDAVNFPTERDFVIAKTEEGFQISVNYVDQVPYIANISLVAAFDNTIEIRR